MQKMSGTDEGEKLSRKVASAVTEKDGVRVCVRVRWEHLPEPPIEDDDDFWFAYHIRIENLGEVPLRLISRRWTITDGDNRVREVKGEGVVGEQPYLRPGARYEYASYVDMPTPVGTMNGAYIMRRDDAGELEVEIPMFSLAVPASLN